MLPLGLNFRKCFVNHNVEKKRAVKTYIFPCLLRFNLVQEKGVLVTMGHQFAWYNVYKIIKHSVKRFPLTPDTRDTFTIEINPLLYVVWEAKSPLQAGQVMLMFQVQLEQHGRLSCAVIGQDEWQEGFLWYWRLLPAHRLCYCRVRWPIVAAAALTLWS